MKTNLLLNPYYCYIISFGLALFIYSWSWSEIYPALTSEVIIFLFTTFLIAFILGKRINKKLTYRKLTVSSSNEHVVFFIMIGYCLEFIYNGGIPLLLILRGVDISYMDFGIPTFHVLLLTFSSFYSVYIFHQLISSQSTKILLLFIVLLVPYALIINRGALIMILVACLLIYISSIRRVAIKKLTILLISFAFFFYGFGYLGNARSFNGDPMAFLTITKATDDFVDGPILKEYYWFYIYASSPFANFQNATLTSTIHRYDVAAFLTWELLPDFISKRIIPTDLDYDAINRLDYSINPILTVGSIYFDPFIRLGWFGPISIFLFYALFVYLYVLLIPSNSKYFLSAIVILGVISIFNVFENMLNFSGLSVQLIYPLVLHKLNSVKLTGFKIKGIRLKLGLPKFKIRF